MTYSIVDITRWSAIPNMIFKNVPCLKVDAVRRTEHIKETLENMRDTVDEHISQLDSHAYNQIMLQLRKVFDATTPIA